MMEVRGLIEQTPGVSTTVDTNQGEKGLLSRQVSTIFPLRGKPIGDCRS